ncbi:hypothetical protein ACJMK2_028901 [Sinanodonta woodiana]|uniref:Uncharacterized protein n=1 Tax=Sinanodonta woodiana TaxID=1069815 RepID=A0ABD3X925_SINWO
MAEGNQMCSICLDTLKDPKTLSCNHAFCSGCIEGHVLQNGRNDIFTCPLCNREVKISRDDVNSVMGEGAIESPIIRVSPKCDVCGPNISAACRCLDCEENYCQVCSEVHIKMKSSRNHTLRDLAVLDCEEIVAPRRHMYCPEHLEEEIKIVCKACKNIPICQFCKILKHDTHASRLLADEAMEIRSIFEKNLTLCKEQLEYLERCTRDSEARDKELDMSEQGEIRKIIHQEDYLVYLLKCLNERIKIQAEQLNRDIRQRYTEARKENDVYKGKLAMEKIKCQSLQGEAQELIDTTTDIQVVQMADRLTEEFKHLEKDRKLCSTNPQKDQRNVITPATSWMQSIESKIIDILKTVPKEEGSTIQLCLIFLTGQKSFLEVNSLDQTIREIKQKIHDRHGIPEGNLRLRLPFLGKELQDNNNLRNYCLHDGSQIEVIIKVGSTD